MKINCLISNLKPKYTLEWSFNLALALLVSPYFFDFSSNPVAFLFLFPPMQCLSEIQCEIKLCFCYKQSREEVKNTGQKKSASLKLGNKKLQFFLFLKLQKTKCCLQDEGQLVARQSCNLVIKLSTKVKLQILHYLNILVWTRKGQPGRVPCPGKQRYHYTTTTSTNSADSGAFR